MATAEPADHAEEDTEEQKAWRKKYYRQEARTAWERAYRSPVFWFYAVLGLIVVISGAIWFLLAVGVQSPVGTDSGNWQYRALQVLCACFTLNVALLLPIRLRYTWQLCVRQYDPENRENIKRSRAQLRRRYPSLYPVTDFDLVAYPSYAKGCFTGWERCRKWDLQEQFVYLSSGTTGRVVVVIILNYLNTAFQGLNTWGMFSGAYGTQTVLGTLVGVWFGLAMLFGIGAGILDGYFTHKWKQTLKARETLAPLDDIVPSGNSRSSQRHETGDRLLALHDYTSREEDELTVKRGDVLVLEQVYGDGWILAKKEEDGVVGRLPRSEVGPEDRIDPGFPKRVDSKDP